MTKTVEPWRKSESLSPMPSVPVQAAVKPAVVATTSTAAAAKPVTMVASANTPVRTQNVARTAAAQTSVVMYEKQPMPARSNVSSVVVVLASAEDSPAVATASLQSWLKERVVSACGKEGRDLELVLRSPTQMSVDIKARDSATAQQLSRKILAMQELEPYRVTLRIQVPQ